MIVGRYAWNDLRHGQTNLLVVGLVCAALWYARCRREGAAGVALALALVIKPTAWPLGVWYLVRGRLRLIGLGALAGVAALAVPGLLYGPADYVGEVGSWLTRMRSFAREEALPPPELAARGSTLVNAAASAWAARAAQALGASSPVEFGRVFAWLTGGLALVWTLWRRPRYGAAACVLLGAWLSPVTWKAHLVVLAIPAAIAARRLGNRPTPLLWGVWAVWLALIALPKLVTHTELWGASTAALAIGWWWCVNGEEDCEPSAV